MAAASHAGGTGGIAGGGSAEAALLENENMKLREREQALMDAVSELGCLCGVADVLCR